MEAAQALRQGFVKIGLENVSIPDRGEIAEIR
jgi:hypothetical protein